jgi:hypothetical protein
MGIAQRGLASVAWAMGRVAGIVARALRVSRRPGVRRRKLPEREALLAEIAGLENELDQAALPAACLEGEITQSARQAQ